MTDIRRLQPGQQPSRETINELIDLANRKQQPSPGVLVQDGAGGSSVSHPQSLKPVWGELTAVGPDEDKPHFYEWREVFFDLPRVGKDATWQGFDDVEPTGVYRAGSTLVDSTLLLNPAVEINEDTPNVGSIVRLTPGPMILDDQANFHRHWLFPSATFRGVRSFKLTADLIPTGGGEPDLTIAAEWLDTPGEDVTLYPAHRSGWPAGDEFFNLGVGRGPGNYFAGTYGWATYVPKATIIGVDAEGEPIWRAEWQIVTLYTSVQHQALVSDTIWPGDKGKANLIWFDKQAADGAMLNSGYEIDLFNSQAVPLHMGVYEMHWNRPAYRWVPTSLPRASGITIYQSASQIVSDSFETLQTDITEISYGLGLSRNGFKIKNNFDVPLIGLVSWQISARRDLPAIPDDIDSVCHVALYNAGNFVVGTESEMSSSRRRVENPEGESAVNTCSGSFTQQLIGGATLEMRIKYSRSFETDDGWATLPEQCHLTFHTQPGAYPNP